MPYRRRPLAALTASAGAIALLAGASAPGASVRVQVTQLRSDDGQVLACLTARADAFPDCSRDPEARKRTVPAREGEVIDFGPLPEGRYAVSLVHDENGNGRLDKRLMFPREGYGFSRDAPVRFGPPSFAAAAFALKNEDETLPIRMRYLL